MNRNAEPTWPEYALDAFLESYNTKRPHQGRGMKGRTPATVFLAGIEKSVAKEVKTAA